MGRMAVVLALGAAFALPLPQDTIDADKAAIRQAVLDYAEGFYGHAPDRMERAVSPLLSKRGLNLRPGLPYRMPAQPGGCRRLGWNRFRSRGFLR